MRHQKWIYHLLKKKLAFRPQKTLTVLQDQKMKEPNHLQDGGGVKDNSIRLANIEHRHTNEHCEPGPSLSTWGHPKQERIVPFPRRNTSFRLFHPIWKKQEGQKDLSGGMFQNEYGLTIFSSIFVILISMQTHTHLVMVSLSITLRTQICIHIETVKSINSPVYVPLQGQSSFHTKCLKYLLHRHSPRPYLFDQVLSQLPGRK